MSRILLRYAVRSTIILLPLLGLTWAFGLLCVNDDLIVFQYLFTIFNSLQVRAIFFVFFWHQAPSMYREQPTETSTISDVCELYISSKFWIDTDYKFTLFARSLKVWRLTVWRHYTLYQKNRWDVLAEWGEYIKKWIKADYFMAWKALKVCEVNRKNIRFKLI